MNDVSNRAVREFSEFLNRVEVNFPKPTCTTAYEITMKSTIVSALITLDTEKQMDERFWNHLRVQRNILDFLYTLWLVIFPFRGGVGVRHSFHGLVCAIQYRQPHLMRNALNGNGCIDHESGDRIIDIGQTVELFDLIAGRRIQLLHLCPSIRPAHIFQFSISRLFDFHMVFEVDAK